MITPNGIKVITSIVKVAAIVSEFVGPFQGSKWGLLVFAIASAAKDAGTALLRSFDGTK